MGMCAKKRKNCRTPLLALLLLAGIDAPSAFAQEVAVIPSLDLKPIIRREDLLESLGIGAGTLAGLSRPIYDVKDFVQAPSSDSIDPLLPVDSDTALAGLVRPAYTPEMFSPKAIAQAKPEAPKPATPKSEEDDTADIDEVSVTDKRRTRPENKVTGTTFTVTRQDITATGATTVAEALTKIAPGFFAIDSLGGLNTDQGVFLRGLGSNRFLVLIDGRPTTRPSNNRSVDLGRLGVSNIERIELVTGGAGLRYGAGAIAGAINVITRLPEGPDTLKVTVEGGSFGFSRQTVNFVGTNGVAPRKPGYIGYELNYERRSALNNYSGTAYQRPVGFGIGGDLSGASIPAGTPSVDFVNQGATETYFQGPISYQKPLRAGYVFSNDYAAKIIYQPALDHTLRASFGFASIRSGDQFAFPNQVPNCTVLSPNNGVSLELVGGEVDPTLPSSQGYVSCNIQGETATNQGLSIGGGRGDQAVDSLSGSLSWDWKLSETNKFSFIGAFAADYEDNPSSPGTRIASSQIINLQFNYSAELTKNNNLNAGFEYFQQRYNTTPLIGRGGNQQVFLSELNPGDTRSFFALDVSKSSYAFYATDQWRFFDDAVVVDLGVRATTDQFFGTYTTPGAGFRWNFGGPKNQEMFALKASWFQSFRAPGLADIFGYNGFNSGQVVSNGPAELLRNLQLKPETGVSYDIGLDVRLSPSTLFRIVYFRTDLNNAIINSVAVLPLPKTIGPNYALAPVPGNPAILVLPDQFRNSAKYTIIPTTQKIGGVDIVQVSPYTQQQLNTIKFQDTCGIGQLPFINGQSTCAPNLLTNYNAQSYLSTGWEFSFRWQITPQLEFSSSYSLVDSRPIGDPLNNTFPDTVSGTTIPFGSGSVQGGYFYNYQGIDIPFSTGNVGLRYSDGRFRVALNGLFIGLRPRASGGNNYNEPYSRWDITFGVPLTDEITFTGGVFNLFNDRSVLADNALAVGGGVLQAPTTFRLGVEMAFSAKQ
jgi:iron complex outermembrane recepter protein